MELQIIDLKKCYKKTTALKGVSFTLTPGIYGLLGPNGSGKSTLMNIITSNIKATSGTVLWNGKDINKLGKDYRAILGYVPQQQALYPDFSVHTFLEYVAALRELPKKEVRPQIAAVLQQVELTEVADYKIRMLSGGMKQRLLIAQAVLGNPRLLIMDEPTVGLDPKQRMQIRELIQKISEDKIVLIATHIVSDLEWLADAVLLLKEGNLIKKGSRETLIEETKREIREQTAEQTTDMQAGGLSSLTAAAPPDVLQIRTLEDVYLYYFGE